MARASFTFIVVLGAYDQFKICTITEFVRGDDFAFQLEDRDARAIKSDPGWLSLRLETEEHGGRHDA